eukprot:3955016-Prymnesium_polylepis.1
MSGAREAQVRATSCTRTASSNRTRFLPAPLAWPLAAAASAAADGCSRIHRGRNLGSPEGRQAMDRASSPPGGFAQRSSQPLGSGSRLKRHRSASIERSPENWRCVYCAGASCGNMYIARSTSAPFQFLPNFCRGYANREHAPTSPRPNHRAWARRMCHVSRAWSIYTRLLHRVGPSGGKRSGALPVVR